MIIKTLEVANFRKFRESLRIDSLADGLNIVVEPNETGKSTLLEALRAAFFIRYSARTELVRSFVPIGDDVAPRVAVGFAIQDQDWLLEKQFMKSPSVRLTGGGSRRESDAAEEALQELLGFERGNNRGSDIETRGPLGLLWVEQASALAVENPNRIVRDTVRGVLEAEVGAVTGGKRFDAIRANVDEAYLMLRTPTGKSRGPLTAAEVRQTAAAEARYAAEISYREYEGALTELDEARSRLKIVERDLADPETVAQRTKLEEELKTAENVALRLKAAEAESGRLDEIAKTATSRIERLVFAEARVAAAQQHLAEMEGTRTEAKTNAAQAGAEERAQRGLLEKARSDSEGCEVALTAARECATAFAKAAGARRAIDARKALGALEERERALVEAAGEAVDKAALKQVLALERAAIEARARFDAGVVKVDVERGEGTSLQINGEPSVATSIDVLRVTRFQLGDAGSIIVCPPHGSGLSIEADRAAANEALAAALRSLGITSHAEGVAKNERAAAAERELKALRTQISSACPGDPTIGLAAGADALRAFVVGLGDGPVDAAVPSDDFAKLEKASSDARLVQAAASGKHEEARTALAKVESALASAEAGHAAAVRDAKSATEDLETVLKVGDREALDAGHLAAQRNRAAQLDELEQARASATVLDADAIRRRIENLDRAARQAGDDRLQLTARIASLESTIAREGTCGPAGRLAEAQEEEEAAITACDRRRREADTLEMLRKSLAQAANDASQTFLAPVTTRATRYIERLLPGSDLSFNEELGLTGLTRAGMDETCGNLSRGTQEQLAILTRLAFADLLLEDGAPISLILDDPLVYSDDNRLEMMTDILQDASTRMQVILLTCRSKAFRHVDANRIRLK